MSDFWSETEEYVENIRKQGLLEYWNVEELHATENQQVLEQKFEMVGTKKSTGLEKLHKKAAEKLIAANSKNLIGYVDYNEYATKSTKGFLPTIQKIFCDNVIVYVYAAVEDVKNGNWKYAGAANTMVRTVFRSGNVTARKVMCTNIDGKNIVEEMPFPGRKEKVPCYKQHLKITLHNQKLEDVVNFLGTGVMERDGIFLGDLDATEDFAGSFSKDVVIQHLLEVEGFRMQGSDVGGNATIIDNDQHVGRNCLTFILSKNGRTIRCKIYDKMVQMLESYSVRENGGNHWWDWATQQDTPLANARDNPDARERGLTRMEITFYANGFPITMQEILGEMAYLKKLFPKEVCLDTPYARKWEALTDHLEHTLVVHDVKNDLAYFAYTYNQFTGKNSYASAKKFSVDRDWILGNLSFKSHLPIHVVEFKITEGRKKYLETKSYTLAKVWNGDFGGEHTRLTNNNAFRKHKKKGVSNEKLLESAGFLPTLTVNMVLPKDLPKKQEDYEFYGLPPVPAQDPYGKTKPLTKEEIAEQIKLATTADVIDIRKRRLAKIRALEERIRLLEEKRRWEKTIYKALYNRAVSLTRTLGTGVYDIFGYRKQKTNYGETKILVLQKEGTKELQTVWATNKINEKIMEIIRANKLPPTYVSRDFKITITGFGVCNGYPFPYFRLRYQSQPQIVYEPVDRRGEGEPKNGLPITPLAGRKFWKDILQLTGVREHTVLELDSCYEIEKYKKKYLVIVVKERSERSDEGGTEHYFAGQDLQEQKKKLLQGVKIRVGKKTCSTGGSRMRYRECILIQPGEWWLLAPVNMLGNKELPKERDILSTKIMDENTILVLLEDNRVVNLRKGPLFKKNMDRGGNEF